VEEVSISFSTENIEVSASYQGMMDVMRRTEPRVSKDRRARKAQKTQFFFDDSTLVSEPFCVAPLTCPVIFC
jgi:hypothetical protein